VSEPSSDFAFTSDSLYGTAGDQSYSGCTVVYRALRALSLHHRSQSKPLAGDLTKHEYACPPAPE